MNFPSPICADLPDTGNAGLDSKTLTVQIIVDIFNNKLHLRPWPDQTHRALQDIEQLRELIQARFRNSLPTRVILASVLSVGELWKTGASVYIVRNL